MPHRQLKRPSPRGGKGWRLKLQHAYEARRRATIERDRALAQATQARPEVERLLGVVEDMSSRIQFLLNATSQPAPVSRSGAATSPSSAEQTLLTEASREIAMQSAVIEGLVARVRALMRVAGIEVELEEDGWRYRITRLRDAWDGPFGTPEEAVAAAASLLLAQATREGKEG
jgi:hypothetical protein